MNKIQQNNIPRDLRNTFGIKLNRHLWRMCKKIRKY